MSEFTYNVNGLVSDSEATFATVQRAFAEAMARPPTAADEVRALAAVAEAEGKPCVLPDELIARLEAEARAVLREVEPWDSFNERANSREFRSTDEVDMCPHSGARPPVIVPLASWRPRATRTPSGWAITGGWLDEAVPELPTRGVPNAGGTVPMVAACEHDDGEDSVCERYGTAVGFVPVLSRRLPTMDAIQMPRPIDGTQYLPPKGDRETPKFWQERRRGARGSFDGIGRGWCDVLRGLALATDADLAGWAGEEADWLAMQRAHDRVIAETDAAWAQERAAIVRAKGEG